MVAEQRSVTANVVVPIDFPYNYRVGQYLEKFIKGLGDGKIMGIKCPGCGKVVVPPRGICGSCNRVMEEWVEVGPEGTIESFTVGHVKLDKGLVERIDTPTITAMIKLEGADALLPGMVRGIDPVDVKTGTRVKAVFADPPQDGLADLDHFEPAG